jgi:flagellin
MTVINTNTAATLTANALQQNQRAMNQTMERLSTGSRINSAKDDAAGLAIVSKMDAQIKGTNMAIRNANDAISMISTADGAAIEIDAMLQRMREIAVQSLNETNTTTDLTNLNKEFAQLATEIDRVANETEFNDMTILKGDQGGADDGIIDFNLGSNTATMEVDFGDFNMAGGAAVAGVQTMTISDGDIQTGAADTDGYKIVFESGKSMIITAAQVITAATAEGNNGASDISNDKFVAAFNTANLAAEDNGTTVPDITASIVNDVVTFTEATGSEGQGAIASISLLKTNSSLTAITTTSAISTTTTGAVAGGASVMANDISDFKTAGVQAQASTTIAELDAAIAGVASKRADFGAFMNRLEYTVDNLSNVVQNTVSARSRIEDADYAAETTELARSQIIAQAATAMLSQANQQAQSVLALLK